MKKWYFFQALGKKNNERNPIKHEKRTGSANIQDDIWEVYLMLSTYEKYQSMPASLTLEKMTGLHREMTEEIGNDSYALELYKELLSASVRYLESRSNWPLWSREKKLEEDSTRTSRHNKVILAFDTLARYLEMQGNTASWRAVLGKESETPYYRKRIGDFACYLAFIGSLNAR